MKHDLEQLGFTSHEAAIYLALIEAGQTGAGELIKRTGLHRNIVYSTLDKLIAKKLVSRVIRQKTASFQVTDPNRILSDIESKRAIAANLVPSLINKAGVKQEIVIYEGLDGFRSSSINIMEQMDKNSILYVLGSIGDQWYELMGTETYKRYENIRLKKKITLRMISYGESAKDRAIIEAGKYYEVKIIPRQFETPANTLIWNDTIALQTFAEPYSVIHIKNPALAKSYLNYFDLLWNQK